MWKTQQKKDGKIEGDNPAQKEGDLDRYVNGMPPVGLQLGRGAERSVGRKYSKPFTQWFWGEKGKS